MLTIASRGTLHGTALGTYRWVVERSLAWLHGFRRLRVRWQRRADIHKAFPHTSLPPHHPSPTQGIALTLEPLGIPWMTVAHAMIRPHE